MILKELLKGGVPNGLKDRVGKDYIWAFYFSADTKTDLDPSILEEMDECLLKPEQANINVVKKLTDMINNGKPKAGEDNEHEQEQILI